MTIRQKAECALWGDSFSPALLEDIPDIHFRLAHEVGDIARLGRYKGKLYPYGACHLGTPELVTQESVIEWMADFVAAHKEKFVVAGATSIVFWIYWYGGQGNTELSVVELNKLAALQIPLCMDYIFTENFQSF